jgi:hypothetical protein
VIAEKVSPIIVFLEFVLLDHGPHGPIEDENPLLEGVDDIKGVCLRELASHDESVEKLALGHGVGNRIDLLIMMD